MDAASDESTHGERETAFLSNDEQSFRHAMSLDITECRRRPQAGRRRSSQLSKQPLVQLSDANSPLVSMQNVMDAIAELRSALAEDWSALAARIEFAVGGLPAPKKTDAQDLLSQCLDMDHSMPALDNIDQNDESDRSRSAAQASNFSERIDKKEMKGTLASPPRSPKATADGRSRAVSCVKSSRMATFSRSNERVTPSFGNWKGKVQRGRETFSNVITGSSAPPVPAANSYRTTTKFQDGALLDNIISSDIAGERPTFSAGHKSFSLNKRTAFDHASERSDTNGFFGGCSESHSRPNSNTDFSGENKEGSSDKCLPPGLSSWPTKSMARISGIGAMQTGATSGSIQLPGDAQSSGQDFNASGFERVPSHKEDDKLDSFINCEIGNSLLPTEVNEAEEESAEEQLTDDPTITVDTKISFGATRRHRRTSCFDMDELRKVREQVLVDQLDWEGNRSDNGAMVELLDEESMYCKTLRWIPGVVLSTFGIVSLHGCLFKGERYHFAISLVLPILSVLAIVSSLQEANHYLYFRIAEVCFAAGTYVAFVALRLNNMSSLIGPSGRLDIYAKKYLFVESWMSSSLRNGLVVLLFLASFYATPLVGTHFGTRTVNSTNVLVEVAYVVHSAFFAALAYCLLHLSCGLELMVDRFCTRFFDDPVFTTGIQMWNVMQALLRKTARAMEVCFVALQTSAMAALILSAAQIVAHSKEGNAELASAATFQFLSWLAPTFLMLYCLFRAAVVTEKCLRVPALVNSLISEHKDTINVDRSYMVEYLEHSAAGFYVYGVRVTAFMVMKYTYIVLLGTFTFISQTFPASGR
eukprot:TRINITY_DN38121_c0_g1_i1.p1 TRINITY_DN38121_c0_g1~~TRINITY_DN38121_c0_g1_i1.p1  ORF type:complete len:828 (-),score=113.71 TRINITY_DN38121_c0_g1_i1:145-2589(-)